MPSEAIEPLFHSHVIDGALHDRCAMCRFAVLVVADEIRRDLDRLDVELHRPDVQVT
jgi:hypothetical protein